LEPILATQPPLSRHWYRHSSFLAVPENVNLLN